MSSEVHEHPRSEVIYRYIREAIARGVMTQESYADEVRMQFERLVPQPMRCLHFHDPEASASPSRALATNRKHVFRWFDPEATARMPVDLEEAVVEALPEPERTECRRELGWRLGLWGSIRRPLDASGDYCCLGDLAREFGQLSTVAGQMLANGGELGPQDAADLPELQRQARVLQANIQALIERADRRTAGASGASNVVHYPQETG
ncbi:hypothetical protein [Halorhodospira sp. 9622]|uniref:hypothetical protein n=1 Tax=Halorhodospira sp. 9622 TaxID=2899136 RepID=UPI001EE7D805|nr:hypothetical protein [Halorhodospira sp. 9622]MCG5538976.1 hypothetical protein [Halorhodospira sp. 9622]